MFIDNHPDVPEHMNDAALRARVRRLLSLVIVKQLKRVSGAC